MGNVEGVSSEALACSSAIAVAVAVAVEGAVQTAAATPLLPFTFRFDPIFISSGHK
jgi:hypothetical protein